MGNLAICIIALFTIVLNTVSAAIINSLPGADTFLIIHYQRFSKSYYSLAKVPTDLSPSYMYVHTWTIK